MGDLRHLQKFLSCPLCYSDLELNGTGTEYRCKGCGERYHIEMGIPIMLPSSAEITDKSFVKFVESLGSMERYRSSSKWIWEEESDTIKKYINFDGKVVFDAGCGCGYITSMMNLMEKCEKTFLIDLSLSQLIAFRQNNAIDDAENIFLICGDIETSILNYNIDILICTHVLEHLLRPDKALATFNKLLTSDGVLYASVPILNFPLFRNIIILLFRKFRGSGYNDHLRVYSTKSLITDLNAAGFVVDKIIYHSMYRSPFSNGGTLNRWISWLLAKGVTVICSKRK